MHTQFQVISYKLVAQDTRINLHRFCKRAAKCRRQIFWCDMILLFSTALPPVCADQHCLSNLGAVSRIVALPVVSTFNCRGCPIRLCIHIRTALSNVIDGSANCCDTALDCICVLLRQTEADIIGVWHSTSSSQLDWDERDRKEQVLYLHLFWWHRGGVVAWWVQGRLCSLSPTSSLSREFPQTVHPKPVSSRTRPPKLGLLTIVSRPAFQSICSWCLILGHFAPRHSHAGFQSSLQACLVLPLVSHFCDAPQSFSKLLCLVFIVNLRSVSMSRSRGCSQIISFIYTQNLGYAGFSAEIRMLYCNSSFGWAVQAKPFNAGLNVHVCGQDSGPRVHRYPVFALSIHIQATNKFL